MKLNTLLSTTATLLAATLVAQSAQAAIALDRTRVIFDATHTSLSLSISNQNKTLPYLAQAWLEDADGHKIESPLTALPPLQRVEPGAKSQVKLQLTGSGAPLPADRESLFYLNLREIPPKSTKPNTLQLALQTRVKLFYRPAELFIASNDATLPQKQLTLSREGDRWRLNNPTGYYVTVVQAAAAPKDTRSVPGFNVVMVAPKDSALLGGTAATLGAHPVLTWINDYGGRPQLIFSCSGNTCKVIDSKAG